MLIFLSNKLFASLYYFI
uniref:Histonelysine Nmethyltransferase SETMARlike [Ceratitis capitata] n=1 Tax=Lepeophtheirus salmonis TaxID=72036 RepID=A0A0K2TLG1_LEPSM